MFRKHQYPALRIVAMLFLSMMLLNCLSFSRIEHVQAAGADWVTHSGSQLMLNGSSFRFAGTNIYWLGLDEGARTYPTQFRINDALTAANEMGATVVRAHSLGISTGCPLCVEPTLGSFNSIALEHIDYAIKAAQEHGLHLIIPLADNYHYYHGGKHNFTDWRGISDENQFYTNPTVIADFEQYISVLLNRVNSYTGIAYKDDPTIMAWETGNELLGPASWTQQIASYIKSIDSQHLVMDGHYGIDPNSLGDPNVDIYSDHSYPPNINQMNADAAMTRGANKAFVIGEYDWQTPAGDPLDKFLSAMTANPNVAGDVFWGIWPHNDNYGYLTDNDRINLNYPGDTPDRRSRIQIMRRYAYQIEGLPQMPDSIPGAPLITSVVGNQIAWRGTAVADTYSVERSTVSALGPWTVICNRCATDYSTPWSDITKPADPVWYRVRGFNLSGVGGAYSPVYGNGNAAATPAQLIDNLNDWSQTYKHSADLHFDSSNPEKFSGDTSRAFRWSVAPDSIDEIVWRYPGMKSFTATAYFWPDEPVSQFAIYTADSTLSWTQMNPTITGGWGDWVQYTYTLNNLWNSEYVKVRWNNNNGHSWSPQLGQVIIS